MTQILRTTRALPTETITLEPAEGLDGQGLTSYGSPVEFEGNVLEYDGQEAAQFVVVPDGSKHRVRLTIYVQGDSATVPDEEDRVTLSDGREFIVVDKKTVSGLTYSRTAPDHYRLRCRLA